MNRHPNLIKPTIMLALLLYASYRARPFLYSTDMALAVYILWGLTALCAVDYLRKLPGLFLTLFHHIHVHKPKNEKGSARWCRRKEARKAGYMKKSGFLFGMLGKIPIFGDIESSGLVLSPAGGGKTLGFVIPALMHNPISMVVPDLKGTLAVQTMRFRAKKFRHKVFCLNPGGLYQDKLGPGARYNPLQILINDWADAARHKFMMTDSQSLAKQLIPEPPSEGENQFFRSGSRKLLSFAMLFLVTLNGKTTLAAVLAFLSDMTEIEASLYTAQSSDALNGDLRRLANDLIGKLGSTDRRQFESFREGALQALEPYSPSGVLAEATAETDFEFADLRRQPGTVYIICDPTQAGAFESWVGLVMLNAITELIRFQNNKPVCLMLDEVTNFKIQGLPKLLTSLREFQIKMWLIVQELEQFSHVYGKEAKETLLSQTEIKIIHGSRSHATCDLVSKMLGNESIRSKSYNIGRDALDKITRTVSETGKPLLPSDEVARFEKMIVFSDKVPPMALDKIGCHEIAPWRDQVDPNPLFGNKRYKGKIRLRL